MKLAEALQERSAILRCIRNLENRLEDYALVQEGETAAEDPAELLAELDECARRYADIATRINLTNAALLVGGETMTALLARREAMKLRLSAWQETIAHSRRPNHRIGRNEIRMVSTIDIPALQKRINDLSRDLRELDSAIQCANWNCDLT